MTYKKQTAIDKIKKMIGSVFLYLIIIKNQIKSAY